MRGFRVPSSTFRVLRDDPWAKAGGFLVVGWLTYQLFDYFVVGFLAGYYAGVTIGVFRAWRGGRP